MKIAILFFSTLIILILASTCYYDSQEFLYPKISSNCDSIGTIPFSSVDSVLKANCFTCHDGPSATSGLDLNGYDKVYPYATTIRSGQHNPILQGVIRRMPGFSIMPPSPSPPLDNCGIRIIELWIEQGSQNN